MKTRRGFVSNSSTTSFCIYGARCKPTIEDLKKFKKALPEKYLKAMEEFKSGAYSEWRKNTAALMENLDNADFFKDIRKRGCEHTISYATNDIVKFCPECGKPVWIIERNPNVEKLKELEDAEFLANALGLEYHSGEEGDGYIGRSWTGIKDNETGADFKRSVDEILEVINGKKGQSISEAWYNG